MMSRKPSRLGSHDQPRPTGSGAGLASTGSGGRTKRGVVRFRQWEGEGLKWNRDWVALTPMSDHCASVVHADEPGASISVQDCLVRLKGGGRTELQLQEFRAGDRVETERVHTRKVRQPSRSFVS